MDRRSIKEERRLQGKRANRAKKMLRELIDVDSCEKN